MSVHSHAIVVVVQWFSFSWPVDRRVLNAIVCAMLLRHYMKGRPDKYCNRNPYAVIVRGHTVTRPQCRSYFWMNWIFSAHRWIHCNAMSLLHLLRWGRVQRGLTYTTDNTLPQIHLLYCWFEYKDKI
jgi:hypothetical protein